MWEFLKSISKAEKGKTGDSKKNKQIILVRNTNNGDLTSKISLDILAKEFLLFLDLRSLLNLRLSSTELYRLVNQFLGNNPKAKDLGVVALPQGSQLFAVGDTVVHRKGVEKVTFFNGDDAFYGQEVKVSDADIKKSFNSKTTFFSKKEDAQGYIKKQTKTNNYDMVMHRPHLGCVTLKDEVTLAKLKKEHEVFTEQMSIQDAQEQNVTINPN
ncbi:hypothetical protein [Legionella waltersii]|uniref:Uncharacterized protein n=1 Tax=Legionella waltersii TaxID=66969 RepID=A0A0W1A4Y0_9GAMM|nr:hypothetical protein [Legionella waltersii]KTD76329.1 hypothetical protein Lwal_2051 [Legionella waltersii]SNV13762.1 Uncharacterised protein [Legionella waltersii]